MSSWLAESHITRARRHIRLWNMWFVSYISILVTLTDMSHLFRLLNVVHFDVPLGYRDKCPIKEMCDSRYRYVLCSLW